METRKGLGPRTTRGRIVLITAGVAVALTAGVGTAVAATATSGPVSGGVINGCWTNAAINGSHVFKLQNAGTKCPKGTTAISWNQKGPAGKPGPAGPGFDFTTASGNPGPVIPATGTYFVDVVFQATNESGTALAGICSAGADITGVHPAVAAFSSALVVPAGTSVGDASVSGILSVTDQSLVGHSPVFSCIDTSLNPVNIAAVRWYMSPVQTRS